MTTTTLDLATINAAQVAIVTAIRNQCGKWEQESSDAVADGRLSNAAMLEHWAFAADLLASKVSGEFTALFIRTMNDHLNWSSTNRTVGEQLQDALAIEVASSQSDSIPVASA